MKKVLGLMRRCIQDFNMIENGDKIGVGLSGGKDSMLLLYALKIYQKFSQKNLNWSLYCRFGFDGFDTETIFNYCNSLDIPLI